MIGDYGERPEFTCFPEIEILSANTVRAGEDAFGEVLSGCIELNGYLRTLKACKYDRFKFADQEYLGLDEGYWCWFPDKGQREAREILDRQGDFEVECLLMQSNVQYHSDPFMRVLTLELVPGKTQTYLRTGYAHTVLSLQECGEYDFDYIYPEWISQPRRRIFLV